MYTHKIVTTLVSHHLALDLPPEVPLGKAEILVQVNTDESPEANSMSIREFTDWLKTQPRPNRTREDFAAQIEEERAAWGDE
jgi:hypothetical protein